MTALALLASLSVSAPPDPFGGAALPSATANATLAHALSALEGMYTIKGGGGGVGNTITDRLPRFNKLLDQLIDELGEKTAAEVAKREGRSFPAKLVAIGLDRKKHPAVYEELGKVYGDADSYGESELGNRGGPTVVRIRKEHVTEEYRLAWEYRLLVRWALKEMGPPGIQRPRPARPGALNRDPPGGPVYTSGTFEGLRRIGSEASVVTLASAFRRFCRDDSIEAVPAAQEYTLDTLEAIGGPTALVALIESAEWAELQWARRKPPEYGPRGGKPETWVTRLADAEDEQRDNWRKAADQVNKDSLSDRGKEMLTTLQKKFPPLRAKEADKK